MVSALCHSNKIDIPCSLALCIKRVCTMCDGKKGGGVKIFGLMQTGLRAGALCIVPALAQFFIVCSSNRDKEAM